MKKNQKGIAILVSLLFAALLGIIGGTGYYIYKSQRQSNLSLDKTAQLAQKTTLTKINNQSSPVNNGFALPAGWVWYENNKVGIKFAHPVNWTPKTDDNLNSNDEKGPNYSILVKNAEGSDGESESINIEIFPKQSDERTDATFLNGQLPEVSNAKEVNIGGVKSVEYTWQTKPDAASYYYPNPYLGAFVAHGDYKYYISYTYQYGGNPNKYLSSYNSIINSIQFI